MGTTGVLLGFSNFRAFATISYDVSFNFLDLLVD